MMDDTVIRVEHLSKRYRIGESKARYGSLRESLATAVKAPFQKRDARLDPHDLVSRSIWALKDVDFEVHQGEVIGIIGRNGAGKSTLLKILTRITRPTSGKVWLRGRVGSLLEVGTGFHLELTGRENVYLNGAVLGMKRKEIDARFAEIVDFAEIEQFLDTPVKHYSSGMYMRLAFAVAAHLETELLLVDEVLAVGDAAFQRKCLGKMGEISKIGRTILFVSHNMAAINSLCTRGILLENGRVILDEIAEETIREYISRVSNSSDSQVSWISETAPQSDELRFINASILDHELLPASMLDNRKEFYIQLEYEVIKPIKNLRIGFSLKTVEDILLCGSNDPEGWPDIAREPGRYISQCKIPGFILNDGRYLVSFGSDIALPTTVSRLVFTDNCLSFIIKEIEGHSATKEKLPGLIRPKLEWQVEKIS
jgi:lipopolysaccharide transport system ATP-binding protein